jgi:hypothetical protein
MNQIIIQSPFKVKSTVNDNSISKVDCLGLHVFYESLKN